jgi:hypothetical protein
MVWRFSWSVLMTVTCSCSSQRVVRKGCGDARRNAHTSDSTYRDASVRRAFHESFYFFPRCVSRAYFVDAEMIDRSHLPEGHPAIEKIA